MPNHSIQLGHFEKSEDWVGNNAAFSCLAAGCGKVFIVNSFADKEGRECPSCRRSKGFVTASQSKGGKAWIEWDEAAK